MLFRSANKYNFPNSVGLDDATQSRPLEEGVPCDRHSSAVRLPRSRSFVVTTAEKLLCLLTSKCEVVCDFASSRGRQSFETGKLEQRSALSAQFTLRRSVARLPKKLPKSLPVFSRTIENHG